MRRLLPFALLFAAAPAAAQGLTNPFGEATINERPGASVPRDLLFTDAAGRRTTLAALAPGKPLLLAPVLHDCPNLCGVTLSGLAQAVAALPPGQRDAAVIAFGIDPKETARSAAADLRRLRATPEGRALGPVAALTGDERSIRRVTNALGYRYAWDPRIGQYAHVAAVAVLTPDGHLSSWLYGLAPQPAELAAALAAARAERTGSWTDRLLLLCYHYDPATGRYTPAIQSMLRLAAALTLGGLLLLVWRLRSARA